MLKVGILTVSDKAYAGERIDESGAVIKNIIEQIKAEVVYYTIVPDEREVISKTLKFIADEKRAELIFTTGGTGLSPKDITPEATLDVIDRQVPGISEAIRFRSMEKTNRAMLSRAVSGIRRNTLIINLPGSPRAVAESLEVVLPVIEHAVRILNGQTGECARK
jgi:molybdopterin adenylyltransferase